MAHFSVFSRIWLGQTRKLFIISVFMSQKPWDKPGTSWDTRQLRSQNADCGMNNATVLLTANCLLLTAYKEISKISETRVKYGDNSFRNGRFHVPLSSGTRPERGRNVSEIGTQESSCEKPTGTTGIAVCSLTRSVKPRRRTHGFRFSSKFRKLAFHEWGRQASTGACIDL